MVYFCSVNFIKTAILSLLILFTFVGNIGLRVFTHSCEEDGIFRSYFVELQDHCQDKKKEVLPPCCQKEQKQSCGVELKDDCCQDEVDVYKINFDYYSELKIQLPDHLFLSVDFNFSFDFKLYPLASIEDKREYQEPPKASGRQLLILNQLFRI
jgi:hypothetical protein